MNYRVFMILVTGVFVFSNSSISQPIKIGVAGLTHTHVHWILGREDLGDIRIVGIAEPNKDLAERYTEQHGLSMDLVYASLEEMIEKTKPDAVTAFGTIYDHLEVVKICAPRGIHVMVEKPLAVSLEHAKEMKALAEKHNIHLLTNYETTWYPTNHKAKEILEDGQIGALRKMVIHDGHRGPKKIGVNEEFLNWLIDPILNGGGAITDFGCYGANLATWIHNGERPVSVTAVVQQMQPENNPLVEDDAIIILKYKNSNVLIQASWDWPIGRKDMQIYGLKGVVYADNRNKLRLRIAEGYDGFQEEEMILPERKYPYNDPFSLFAMVIKKEISLEKYALSSFENNMIVVEILDAAIKSAREGKTILLSKK
jgi:predicted dehydrogenase